LILAKNLIFDRTGRVKGDFYVLGHPWTPVYLLDGRRPVLFEAGFACLGEIYEQAIRKVLGRRQPEFLFITHVHYDHCGATAHLKKVFPGLRVAASPVAAQIIRRPRAQKLIRSLSKNVISLITGVDRTKLLREPFEPFEIDIVLADGQLVELEKNLTIQVLASPGHTRDLFSYYIQEKRILIASEGVGCADQSGHIFTEFLVNYEDYMGGLKRMAALDVGVLCQGHHMVFVGSAVQSFFASSIRTTERFKNRVEQLLQAEGGSIERVVAKIKSEEYDTRPLPRQAEKAYLLNLTTKVTHLAEKVSAKKRTQRKP
jgi:glyoxylase-like metal-dependent hydrolase (beta-lactamase superfamily II)